MKHSAGPLLLALLVACSGLAEVEGVVVGLEISYPPPDTLQVGETIQLSAKPLNKNGDSVPTPVTWVSLDTTASLDAATGLLTGVAAGTDRIQASVGSLSSPLVSLAVVAPVDTLIIQGDSVLTVASGTTTSPAMVVRLESFHPPGVLAGRGVIYAITSPDPQVSAPVMLAGGVVVDTLATGADGTVPNATLVVQAGATPPDSVLVEVRAVRTRGAAVPGSGQHFTVRFTP